MSLVSLVLRIATVHALRGATFADDRVRDSMINPAELIGKEAEPFIIVAVDSAQASVTGRDLLGANGQTQLTLDFAVAARVKVEKAAEGEEPEEVVIPHTDAGMEITLDLMVRQLHRVILASQSPWAALWRALVTSIEKITIDRGAAADQGIRYATRQIILTLNTLAEPSFGPVVGVWENAIALLRTNPNLIDIAKLVESEIETPELHDWQRAMADLGLRSSYSLSGEALLEPPPQPITGANIITDQGVWGMDAEAIEDALGPETETEEP